MPNDLNDEIKYGPVVIVGGKHSDTILYYDDDETRRTAICYAGHPIDSIAFFGISKSLLRYPKIDDCSGATKLSDELFKNVR